MSFPRMVEARQIFDQPRLDDYVTEIRRQLNSKGLAKKVKTGQKIAITAGSRGIANIPEILRTVVEEVKAAGGEPFLIPAMGSHGGATSHGQVEALRSLGITEESVCAPIVSSMEVDKIGEIKGTPVYVDRNALRADGIIVVGRVKPHTDFKGEIESGLMKMMAIGLGKQKGAEMIHHNLYEGYHTLLPAAARLIMEKAPILMGLALLENARHETCKVVALEPEEFEAAELKLLKEAKALLPRLPFKELDVLVVEEIGKNISGVGMDTNVTGRFWMPGESDSEAAKIDKLVVLDLSPETHGNAIGIGLADLTTRRVFDKIDYPSTYVNCLTQGTCATGKVPLWLPNDRDAIDTALRVIGPIDRAKARMMVIKNTQELEHIWISESLAEAVKKDKKLAKKIELLGEPREVQFDVLGTLIK
ncbi:MAG: lactate racemase domain-containing protein [Candidatus Bathyarchaeota archaeon]|nr:lactate racemase domain-containing protein [Candidatus Bathyarchaeota archaeon]